MASKQQPGGIESIRILVRNVEDRVASSGKPLGVVLGELGLEEGDYLRRKRRLDAYMAKGSGFIGEPEPIGGEGGHDAEGAVAVAHPPDDDEEDEESVADEAIERAFELHREKLRRARRKTVEVTMQVNPEYAEFLDQQAEYYCVDRSVAAQITFCLGCEYLEEKARAKRRERAALGMEDDE